MPISKVRFLKFQSLLFMRYVWRRKGLWLRAILCWLVGLAFVAYDNDQEYDLRMEIRGIRNFSKDIVLVEIENKPNARVSPEFIEELGILSETIGGTENNLWDSQAWEALLKKIIQGRPEIVGVSPFISENTFVPQEFLQKNSIFFHPKIIWTIRKDSDGKVLWPKFAKKGSLRRTGLNDLEQDRDGIIRRFGDPNERFPFLPIQLAKLSKLYSTDNFQQIKDSTQVINFRGGEGTFTHIGMGDVIEGRFDRDLFKNKIVLIGVRSQEGFSFRTPMGQMSRMEITANIVDNIINNRWIKRLHFFYISILLLSFVFFVALITSKYPQFLALFTTTLVNIFYVTFAIWIFDTLNFWMPIFAPVVISYVTYFIFLSFQLTLKEYLNVQLENETKLLVELEELKNNFLSLISHDLKTPIAKIQGICDRLINQYHEEAFTPDIHALREVATELHQYIKTILQITRVESRDFRINKDATDINEIIETVVHKLDPLAKNKHIQLVVNLEPMFLVEVDHLLLHEVILNLLDNAIKYTPDGGTVTISSQEVDDRVIVMVEDTGPGIPESERQKIFDKFYRGELGKSQPKGSGLGLYLVKYFVELHDGKVFLDSSPKHGTKVGFSMPVSELGDGKDSSNTNQEASNYAIHP